MGHAADKDVSFFFFLSFFLLPTTGPSHEPRLYKLFNMRQVLTEKHMRHSWTFDLNTTVRGYPVMFASFEFGISELRWDIFEANWTEDRWSYPPVEGENGFVGSATSYSQPGRLSPFIYFDSATMQANDTFSFPLVDLVRSYPFITDSYQFWWLGAMADGSQINSGQYT